MTASGENPEFASELLNTRARHFKLAMIVLGSASISRGFRLGQVEYLSRLIALSAALLPWARQRSRDAGAARRIAFIDTFDSQYILLHKS
jgi:hypothetical protein